MIARNRKNCIGSLALIAVLLTVLLAGCASRPSGQVRYGLTLSPSGIDPHVNASSELGIPLTSVYDTLVYLDPETRGFVPGLAERWEISEDGLAYTFYLKEAKFHDGTAFDADAVRFNLDRITSADLKSQKAAFMLGPYDRTEVVDKSTVRIVLKQPFAPLLDSLSQVYLGMASPSAVQKWGTEYQLHQVGTGPFVMADYMPGDHLLLTPNPDYAWGPALYEHPRAQVAEIEFRFYTDPATRSPALETGQADIMGEIPPQDAKRLQSKAGFQVQAVPIPGVSLMFFLNTTRAPLDDVRVRQALLYGTDRQAIVSTVFGGLSPIAYGPLAAITLGYDASVQSLYPYDDQKAAALLAEAGWADADGDGVLDKNGQPLALDAILMSFGSMPEASQLLASQWQSLGIRVDSRVVSYPEALQIAQEGNYHLIPFNLSGSDPDILRKFFHSGASFNWSKADDPEMDGWLDQAAQISDRAQRVGLYSQIQQRVMDEALVVPIRDYVNLNGVSSRVEGLRFDAQGWFPWLIDVTSTAGK
jgi:peptide/nickel transport system substrate-binding protein